MLGLELKDPQGEPTALQTGDIIHLRIAVGFLSISVCRHQETKLLLGVNNHLHIPVNDNCVLNADPEIYAIVKMVAGLLMASNFQIRQNVENRFAATIAIC